MLPSTIILMSKLGAGRKDDPFSKHMSQY